MTLMSKKYILKRVEVIFAADFSYDKVKLYSYYVNNGSFSVNYSTHSLNVIENACIGCFQNLSFVCEIYIFVKTTLNLAMNTCSKL